MKKQKEGQKASYFRSLEEAEAAIEEAYTEASQFLRDLVTVGCYRSGQSGLFSVGIYENDSENDIRNTLKDARRQKAKQLREAISNLEASYKKTKKLFLPLIPGLELALDKLGTFQNGSFAFAFFGSLFHKAHDWAKQFVSIYESDLPTLKIRTSNRILSEKEIEERHNLREREAKEFRLFHDAIDRLNEEIPISSEEFQSFDLRLRKEKSRLLRDARRFLSTPVTVHGRDKSSKDRAPTRATIRLWNKYISFLNEYRRWQLDYKKRTGRKRPSTKDWLLEKRTWKQPSQKLFKDLCGSKDQSEEAILENAIRYARLLEKKKSFQGT